ncbi:hypothetical protein AA0119_g10776 [Alternaria tenuissima]|uniref:Uncharacterized protein n=1 Tax=Alternaria tenuissima TaxID=119927 RepID=A0AB37W1G9_9PLEO|nr:hypothetical protein AA0115_g11299 [Alternaria tenuissima]RYN91042.1 hypothetical protein AA0119_g10776 [Alternaria tenuissima]RYO07159.1 hypothetical protein AA0121_g11775 [Alternaria tenuissima]
MSPISNLLSQPTWRNIGLGLTTTFFALGALSLIRPITAAAALGVYPTTPEGHTINQKSMTFLGIRDVAVATSLFWLYARGQTKETGVLMCSWVLVCVTDTWVAVEGLKERGDKGGIVVLVVGAVVTAVTGLGLLGL